MKSTKASETCKFKESGCCSTQDLVHCCHHSVNWQLWLINILQRKLSALKTISMLRSCEGRPGEPTWPAFSEVKPVAVQRVINEQGGKRTLLAAHLLCCCWTTADSWYPIRFNLRRMFSLCLEHQSICPAWLRLKEIRILVQTQIRLSLLQTHNFFTRDDTQSSPEISANYFWFRRFHTKMLFQILNGMTSISYMCFHYWSLCESEIDRLIEDSPLVSLHYSLWIFSCSTRVWWLNTDTPSLFFDSVVPVFFLPKQKATRCHTLPCHQ